MNFSIRQKLFFLLSGLTITVLVVVLLAVNSTVSNTLTDDVLSNFRQTQGFFQIEQSLRYDRLVESAYLIQENSTFKANVELNDPPSMNQSVNDFAKFIKADLFVVTNNKGQVLSWFNKPAKTGSDLSKTRSTVRDALKGIEPPLQILWPDLWADEGVLYQVVTVPIFSGNTASNVLGTMTLGTELSAADAKELSQNTPLEVVFFLDDKVIAASTQSYVSIEYQNFITKNKALIDSVLNQKIITEPFTQSIGSTDNFNFISPLGKGEPAFYLASVPTAQELSILSKTQQNILIIAGIAILFIIPLAIFLGRILSRPVNKLTDAMAQVEQGNLNVNVRPSSNDEIGRMTNSFNNMVLGLKERFALKKYVGSHTLNMIQSMTDGNTTLGGQETELAILFSDIRGSTATIDKTAPEKFVKELNQLLTQQSQIVVDHEGSIDKYVGDSIVALFSGENALEQALKCSMEMQISYSKSIEGKTAFFDGLGIGVNYGPVILGNMGGNQRMDYTVIGPEVNLCARLCDAAEAGKILIPAYLLKKFNIRGIKTDNSITKELKGFSNKVEVTEIVYE